MDPFDTVYVARAFDEIGRRMMDRAEEMLSTDYPPASEPGESPHRRTGNLQALSSFEVDVSGDQVSLTYRNDAAYAEFLNSGTSRMEARPFADLLQAEFEDQIPDLLAAELTAA